VTVATGDVLKDKYRLEASIGKGGMGEVFSATHIGTGRKVAVKVVSRQLYTELLMARLHREAIAAGRIRSDFVPQVLDIDVTESGELFLVMELLVGEPLSHRMKTRGVLGWDEVRCIGEDVLRGLIDAHTAGVVHRDLKPGNIFIEKAPGGRERAKVLDFGVCKIDIVDHDRLTNAGESLGTVAYMAPEQIRHAADVDERADLYSFGLVVFEALAGRLPFDAEGQVALLAHKLERPARALSTVAQVPVPVGLDALVAKVLARKAKDRHATAQELLRAWKSLGPATVLPRAPPASGAIVAPLPTETVTAGTFTRAGAPSSNRLGLAVAAAALVASAILIAFLATTRPGAKARAAAAPEPTQAASDAVEPDLRTVAPPEVATAAVAAAPTAVLVEVDAGAPRAAPRPPPRPAPGPRPTSTQHITEKPRY
jgi:serine/threonine-protein kinase